MSLLVNFTVLTLFTLAIQLQRASGQECEFQFTNGTAFEPPEFGYPLDEIQDDVEPGKVLFVAEVLNGGSISATSQQNRTYIEATLVEGQFLLKLTDEFAHYEEYEYDRTMTITVTFVCTTGQKQIEFIQPVKDTNNHDPEFLNAPYIYNLPMPFPNNLALDQFMPISARDIDLTNSNITFSLDPQTTGFSISWLALDSNDRKKHNATLVTTSVLDVSDELTFRIIATDTGEPARNASTTVTIRVDQANSVLSFSRSLYIANLTDLKPSEAAGKNITFAEGEIRLRRGADETVEYTLGDEFSDYAKYFERITAADHSSLRFRLVDPPKEIFEESFVLLSLMAKKAGATDTTILHISLPGFDKSACPLVSEECPESEYREATIVLGIFLAIIGAGLVFSVIRNYRHWKEGR